MNRMSVLATVFALSLAIAPVTSAADPAGELKIVFIAYENPNQLMPTRPGCLAHRQNRSCLKGRIESQTAGHLGTQRAG